MEDLNVLSCFAVDFSRTCLVFCRLASWLFGSWLPIFLCFSICGMHFTHVVCTPYALLVCSQCPSSSVCLCFLYDVFSTHLAWSGTTPCVWQTASPFLLGQGYNTNFSAAARTMCCAGLRCPYYSLLSRSIHRTQFFWLPLSQDVTALVLFVCAPVPLAATCIPLNLA